MKSLQHKTANETIFSSRSDRTHTVITLPHGPDRDALAQAAKAWTQKARGLTSLCTEPVRLVRLSLIGVGYAEMHSGYTSTRVTSMFSIAE